jgi:hypothetical protein
MIIDIKRDDGSRAKRENNSTQNTTGLFKAVFDVQGWQSSLMGNLSTSRTDLPGSNQDT